MKIGEAGEAFFVFETEEEVPDNLVTSPILEAYRSAMAFASRPEFAQHVVTKEEYNEIGSNACLRKFKTWRSPDSGHTAAVQTKSKVVEDDEPTPSRRGSRGRGRGSRGRGSDTPAGPRKRGRGRATDT